MKPKEQQMVSRGLEAMREVMEAMYANRVPVDSCILAAGLVCSTGRALGYRPRIQPVRCRVRGPFGQRGRDLGYSGMSDSERYAGHVVAVWNERLVLDPTAAQMTPGMDNVLAHAQLARERSYFPAVALLLDKPLKRTGPPFTAPVGHGGPWDGWTIEYAPFDDGGDWARGIDGETARNHREVGERLAPRVKAAAS